METLHGVRVFHRVAELLSFTAAAESLGLPRATVSTAVQLLERELGTRLLHRTTRRVQLTQDGQVFYERSRDLLVDLDELSGLFHSHGEAISGRLRVDMPVAVARDVVIPALPAFLRLHPQLELELSGTDRKVDPVREGFDCVLRVGSVAESSLIARVIGEYNLVNCVSPAYTAEHGVPESLEELPRHRLIRYVSAFGSHAGGFEYVDPATGEECSVEMPGALTVNSSDNYTQACLAGLGIVQVPLVGVRDHLQCGELIEVLRDYRPAPMPVSLLFANRRHLPRRVRVFMDWLTELLKPRLKGSTVA